MAQRVSTSFLMDTKDSEYGWSGEWNFPPDLFEQGDQQEALAVVARFLKPQTVLQSNFLFKAGGPSTSMYFVNKGSLTVLIEGKKVDYLSVGDYVGEIGMALNEKRTADVQGHTDSEILELSWNDMCKVGFECPSFICSVSKSILKNSGPASSRAQLAARQMLLISSGDVHPSFMRPGDQKSENEIASRKTRVERYEKLVAEEGNNSKIVELMKKFPSGSRLRDAMRDLESAQSIAIDPVQHVMKDKDISEEDLKLVKNLRWLRAAPTAALAEIVARSSVRTFLQGGTILDGKASPRSIFMVCDGTVRVHQASAGRVQTEMANAGKCFGLAGIVPGNRRLQVMEAYPSGEKCKLLELPGADMQQILDLFPVLWEDVDRIRHLRRILPRPGRPETRQVAVTP